ncbi:MAG: T9SS type A sorting domain-containing protein, partial [Bacteroidota bacterium]
NNDGYSDLTMVNETSDDLRILLNDGTGDYNDFELVDMGAGSTPSPNEGADFDGDGEIDLAVCTAWDNELRVLMGDGEGSLSSMETYTTGDGARGLGVLDIDSDGNDDVLIANRSSSNISIFKNDGLANFTGETLDLDPDGDGESGVAIADANNDGIMDVFIGYHGSQEIGLYLGDGVGGLSFSDKVAVFGEPWMIAAGDLNGDGFVDVASANSVGNNMVVNFGDGQGKLSSPVSYQYNTTRFPLAIDLGDLDGDGDLDIVTSNYTSTNFAVFENDGQGGFTLVKLLNSPEHASCAILHDRDNDGDLDISGTDEGDDVLLLFENDAPITNTIEQSEALSLSLSPNPFSEELLLQYELKTAESIDIAIYDIQGKRLVNLFQGQQTSGLHFLRWNGADQNGQLLPEGLYVMMLRTEQHSLAKKVLFSPK